MAITIFYYHYIVAATADNDEPYITVSERVKEIIITIILIYLFVCACQDGDETREKERAREE